MSTRPVVIELDPDPLVETETDVQVARNFSVIADDVLDARAKLLANASVQVGAVWADHKSNTFDTTLVCRGLTIDGEPNAPTGGSGDYIVKAPYSRRRANEAAIGGPAVYRTSGSLTSEPTDTDRWGQPIVNVVNEPMDGVTFLSPTEMLSVEWWTQQTGGIGGVLSNLRQYRGALNSDTWQGAPARCVLCHGIEVVEEGDGDWYRLRGQFEGRPPINVAALSATVYQRTSSNSWSHVATGSLPGFTELKANRGRRIKGDVVGGIQRYVPLETEEPVFLTFDGQRLPDADDPVVLAFPVQALEADFNTLGI